MVTRGRVRSRSRGMRVAYGDVSNSELLRHSGLDRAKVVVSTIDDAFLRGTSNAKLVDAVKAINPRARIIVTAPGAEAANELLGGGQGLRVCGRDSGGPGRRRG